jgi:hypothetical protein
MPSLEHLIVTSRDVSFHAQAKMVAPALPAHRNSHAIFLRKAISRR